MDISKEELKSRVLECLENSKENGEDPTKTESLASDLYWKSSLMEGDGIEIEDIQQVLDDLGYKN